MCITRKQLPNNASLEMVQQLQIVASPGDNRSRWRGVDQTHWNTSLRIRNIRTYLWQLWLTLARERETANWLPLLDEHPGHVVGIHTIQPTLEVNCISFLGFFQQRLHHVLNLLCSDSLIWSMTRRRKQLGSTKPAELPPVRSVRSVGQVFVLSASKAQDDVGQFVRGPRWEHNIVGLTQLFRHISSGNHDARHGTCKTK